MLDALLAIHLEVHDQRFGDRFADRHVRVERAVRILEHHLHAAALRAQVASAERADVDTVEAHRALVGFDQAQHEPAGRGLPGAGLPDEGERLPALEGEADVVDRGDPVGGAPERVALGREPLREALDLEEAHTFTSGTTMPGNLELSGAQASHVDVAQSLERRENRVAPAALDVRAPRVEAATGRRVARRRHVARDVDQAAALPDRRDRTEQTRRVGVSGLHEDVLDRRLLHHLARVHHHDALGHLGDDAEVVADEQDRDPGVGLHLADELEDVRLHGDVERGRGFVGDQERGLARQRHRDHDPLAHAAAERVRVLRRARLPPRDLHPVEHLDRALPRVLARHVHVAADGLGDLLADGERRVERANRLLEDHGHAGTADVGQLAFREADEVATLEVGMAGDAAPLPLDQAEDGERQ